jgi:glucose dehydrogenase
MRAPALAAICLIFAISHPAAETASGTAGNWPFYGGDAGGSRYSPLDQITKSNVAQLKPV